MLLRVQAKTVLVVDDNPQVRTFVMEVLRAGGFDVLEAGSLPEAESLCRKRGSPIDLLLTDVAMPGGSGASVADALRKLQPGLRMIYMSGHGENIITQNLLLQPGVAFLSKPFTPEALSRKVMELTGQSKRDHGQDPP